MTAVESELRINPLICTAIEQRRLVRLRYKNKERIVEPHDYGVHKGVPKLLAYQLRGKSSHPLPNWRWMEEELISEVELLDETFAGGRVTPTGNHNIWDKLFIRVKPAEPEQP